MLHKGYNKITNYSFYVELNENQNNSKSKDSNNRTETFNLTNKQEESNNDQNYLKAKKESLILHSDYHHFRIRNSWLELLINPTKINQSEFKGFLNLVLVLLITYCFTLPISNYYRKGYLFKMGLFYRMFEDFSVLYIIWPLFHIWTYTAYLHEIMILKKYPKFLCYMFNIISEYGILFYATYRCLDSDLKTPPTLYILTQAFVHFFKMHSYTYTNRDYRENYNKYCRLVKEGKISEKKFDKVNYNNNSSNNSGEENKKINFPQQKEDQAETEEKNEFELISSYPNNINFKNFFYFLLAPTFCYQESYPSSGEFKPVYFTLKTMKAFFCLTLMYYIYSESIEPVLPNILNTPLLLLLIDLYFPIALFCLIHFGFIFECILPGYAEMATFGDRQFYDDWWNSTDLAEFNRRWNKIVHMFLHRHVYLECRNRYKLSKLASTSMTFIVSAVLHEYVMCMLIKLFRPILFVMMMVQIPLITIGKKFLKNTTFGNLFFWFSNMLGVNLLFIIYNREYYAHFKTTHVLH